MNLIDTSEGAREGGAEGTKSPRLNGMNRKWAVAAIGAAVAAYATWKAVQKLQASKRAAKGQPERATNDDGVVNDVVYEASVESFPASDPPARVVTVGPLTR